MFKFSKRSLDNLQGVSPDLVKVARRALELTKVDFGVVEGLRTEERQRQLLAEGKSKTINSKHLEGKAIDVLAYRNGTGTYEVSNYYVIAEAFREAAEELGVTIRWGGGWFVLNGTQGRSLHSLAQEYTTRQRKAHKKPLLDFVHFELYDA